MNQLGMFWSKDIVNPSFKEMNVEELKSLGIHIFYEPTTMHNENEVVKSGRGKRMGES